MTETYTKFFHEDIFSRTQFIHKERIGHGARTDDYRRGNNIELSTYVKFYFSGAIIDEKRIFKVHNFLNWVKNNDTIQNYKRYIFVNLGKSNIIIIDFVVEDSGKIQKKNPEIDCIFAVKFPF